MAPYNVSLVTKNKEDIPDWVLNKIASSDIELTAIRCQNTEELLENTTSADVIWTIGRNEYVNEEILPQLKTCKAIMRSGSGLDDIPVKAANKIGIKTFNTPEAIAEIVAEHTVGLLLSFARQIPQHDKNVRAGKWDSEETWAKWHVSRRTVGFIGFGLIAQYVAKMLKGFDMKYLVFDPYADKQVLETYGAVEATFDELLKNSDYVSLHCPLTEKTHHLIGEKEFKAMKETAVLINTSRGPVVDEQALIQALAENWISGAAIDVTEEEPPKADNPLFKLDNAIITPHIAAFSAEFIYKFWDASIEKLKEIRAIVTDNKN